VCPRWHSGPGDRWSGGSGWDWPLWAVRRISPSGREVDLPDRSVTGMRTRTFSMLDAAYAAGVRYVDAARSYGRAEEFLAGWLAERGHADVIVGSKWGYRYTGGWRLDVPRQDYLDPIAVFDALGWPPR
jgi:Aldo/keto reductase family